MCVINRGKSIIRSCLWGDTPRGKLSLANSIIYIREIFSLIEIRRLKQINVVD